MSYTHLRRDQAGRFPVERKLLADVHHVIVPIVVKERAALDVGKEVVDTTVAATKHARDASARRQVVHRKPRPVIQPLANAAPLLNEASYLVLRHRISTFGQCSLPECLATREPYGAFMISLASAWLDICVITVQDEEVTEDAEPDLDTLRIAWGGMPPADQLAAYRRMGPDRRRAALSRISVLQKLATGSRPTRAQQELAAAELGIGLKRLQALMRAWSRLDVDAITPGARVRRYGTSKHTGIEVAGRIVSKALKRNRFVAEPSLHRRVARLCERIGCASPARMTIRRMLTDARRSMEPASLSGVEGLRDAPQTNAGEVLVLARETLAARTTESGGDPKAVEVVLMADAVTGYLLAVVPIHATAQLGILGAAEIRSLPPALRSIWNVPTAIVLGSPLLGPRWEQAMRMEAASRRIAVSRETAQRTRRWTAALLWRGTEELAPLSALADHSIASLPLYGPEDLRDALLEAMDHHNHSIELSVDARLDQHRRSLEDLTEPAAEIILAVLPHLEPQEE